MFKPNRPFYIMIKSFALAACIALPSTGFAQSIFEREQTAAEPDDVYFLAQIKIENPETFQKEYAAATAKLLSQTNAIVLAATPSPQLVEGEWNSNWTVLMRFDNELDFTTFYKNPMYQENLIPVRKRSTSVNNIVLLPAFDPAGMAK